MSKPDLTLNVAVDRRQFFSQAAGLAAVGATGLPKMRELLGSTSSRAGSVSIRAAGEPSTNPGAAGYLLQFKNYIESVSNGDVNVNYLVLETLNTTWPAAVSQLISGQLQMSLPITSYLFTYFPALQVLNLPFLFRDMGEVNFVLGGEIGQIIRSATLHKTGLRCGPWSSDSFIQLPNKKKPIKTLADINGMKIRVQSSGVIADSIQALGGVPSVIAITELYTSLQTGAVEGAAINDNTVLNFKLEPVLPYFSQVNLTPNIQTLAINNKWFAKQGKDVQNLINVAVNGAAAWNFGNEATLESKAAIAMKQQGVKINGLDQGQLPLFKKRVQPVWEQAKGWGPDATSWLKTLENLTAV